MTESKHTPGPFEVQNPMGDDEGLWIVQAGLQAHEWSCIAIVPRDEDRGGKHFITKREQYANAALFEAAPDLLAMLKVAQLWLDVDGRFDMQGINAAISKAEGGQP